MGIGYLLFAFLCLSLVVGGLVRWLVSLLHLDLLRVAFACVWFAGIGVWFVLAFVFLVGFDCCLVCAGACGGSSAWIVV